MSAMGAIDRKIDLVFGSKIACLALLAALTISAALASDSHEGGGVSGGGNVVVCFDKESVAQAVLRAKGPISSAILARNVRSIETLDLLQAKHATSGIDRFDRPEDLDLPGAGETNSDYILRLAKRIAGVSELSRYMVVAVEEMRRNTFLQDDPRLMPGVRQVRDIGKLPYSIDPRRCVLSTAATQTKTPTGTRWDFDRRILLHPKFSRASQAVLFLHEVVYWIDRMLNDAPSSETTREIVVLFLRKTPIRVSELRAVLAASIFKDRYQSKSAELVNGYLIEPEYKFWLSTPAFAEDYETGPHRLRMSGHTGENDPHYPGDEKKRHPLYRILAQLEGWTRDYRIPETDRLNATFHAAFETAVESEFNLWWVPGVTRQAALEMVHEWREANTGPLGYKEFEAFVKNFNARFTMDPYLPHLPAEK